MVGVQELATVAIDKLPTKIFILNNQHLGMVVQWEDRFYKANRAHTYLGRRVRPAAPSLHSRTDHSLPRHQAAKPRTGDANHALEYSSTVVIR